jgi:16S rRNA processing protein RimM
MHLKDQSYIGKIVKLHGYKGGVSLYMDVSNPSAYADLESVFIEIDGILTPFFVKAFKLKNKGFVAIHFEGVDSEDGAKTLVNKKVYIQSSELEVVDETRFLGHELIGYKVFDKEKGDLGLLVEVLEQKGNPLFVVDHNGSEILLPVFEGLLISIDAPKKEMLINAPEGLVDLYLK